MNKQPLHCALRRRYDGIQTRGVNIMRRDTDEQRWEIWLFFFGGGGNRCHLCSGGGWLVVVGADVSSSFDRGGIKFGASR